VTTALDRAAGTPAKIEGVSLGGKAVTAANFDGGTYAAPQQLSASVIAVWNRTSNDASVPVAFTSANGVTVKYLVGDTKPAEAAFASAAAPAAAALSYTAADKVNKIWIQATAGTETKYYELTVDLTYFGDVNRDSQITGVDAMFVANYASELLTPAIVATLNVEAARVSTQAQSGQAISGLDAMRIAQYASELLATLLQ
jgi:hypothetical protein